MFSNNLKLKFKIVKFKFCQSLSSLTKKQVIVFHIYLSSMLYNNSNYRHQAKRKTTGLR